uniref:Uncharacterized protein isoform X3 n=1 Tax=Nicotiana tabacum TaxID=4097 RepID=A0A1S3XT28_TOBAC|nr:PREDICTED: uncharacterized protein LOC107768417 isoform X3 [Nicotiana tabacum]
MASKMTYNNQWRMDEVERREFAGKKAKLAAAELAKLSRRVCDSRAGNSFTSYITAKVLDNIQLSIRNVHILYRDMLTSSVTERLPWIWLKLDIRIYRSIGSNCLWYEAVKFNNYEAAS